MFRFSLLTASCLAAALAGGLTQPPTTPEKSLDTLHPQGGGHPVVPGTAENWPKANGADVASIEAIVGAYYASTAGEAKQPRDWDRFRSLFLPDARLIAARPRGDGSAGAFFLTPDDFVGANRKYLENGGYFEREVAQRVESFGAIAQVWSTYESRRVKDAPQPYARGINSFQLLKDGNRWWIVNIYWDFEREGTPIPEKYTRSAKD